MSASPLGGEPEPNALSFQRIVDPPATLDQRQHLLTRELIQIVRMDAFCIGLQYRVSRMCPSPVIQATEPHSQATGRNPERRGDIADPAYPAIWPAEQVRQQHIAQRQIVLAHEAHVQRGHKIQRTAQKLLPAPLFDTVKPGQPGHWLVRLVHGAHYRTMSRPHC